MFSGNVFRRGNGKQEMQVIHKFFYAMPLWACSAIALTAFWPMANNYSNSFRSFVNFVMKEKRLIILWPISDWLASNLFIYYLVYDILTIDRWSHVFTIPAANAIWTDAGVTAVWVLEAAMFARTLELNMLAGFWSKYFHELNFP